MLSATKSLLSLTAADLMSQNMVMIPREMSLQGAARLLARAAITGAPVVDEAGRCIGVLSATDFMHWVERDSAKTGSGQQAPCICKEWQMSEGAAADTKPCQVQDFMTADPVLAQPGARLGELARMMMDAHVHRIIVADPVTQRPLGIVSTMDILAVLARLEQTQGLAPDFRTPAYPAGVLR